MANTVIHVDGMTCSHCKNAIEQALKTIDGVNNASVNLDAKTVSVDYDSSAVSDQSLKSAISEAGYDVQ